jgi:hypothetical protein
MSNHKLAIGKMEAARNLLIEAYGQWPTAEIRRSRERLEEAIDEVRALPSAGL